MALVPSIDLCLRSNCTELILTETTGVYSESNTGGYGTPNPVLGDVTEITLVITDPEGVEYTLTSADLPDFPTDDTSFEFIIPLSLLGDRTTIEDGYWLFEYTVTTNAYSDNIFTYTTARTFTCTVNCCISNMLSKIKLLGCDTCKNTFTYEDYVKAKALKDSLDNATECGDVDYIEDVLDILTRLCNKSKCKTCN